MSVPDHPSLYVHVPFCRSKCGYCAFVSFGDRPGEVEAYLAALGEEAALYDAEAVATVYVGGGTPSWLTAAQLERLFETLRRHFIWAPDAEVTLEMNPATFDPEKARCLAQLGVNRVSLGLQSFHQGNLAWLGRPYSADEGRQAFAVLRKADFKNINVDIVYSLPGQPQESIISDMEEAMALGPEHLSCYMLAIEAGSRFHDERVRGNDPDTQADDFRTVWERLSRSAWQPYEISNAAGEGFACRHNLNYWRGGNYIGLGLSAHSHREGHRSWNTSDLADYLRGACEDPHKLKVGEEFLEPSRRLLETLLFGLRLKEGVDLGALERRSGAVLAREKKMRLDRFVRDGFLVYEGSFLKATARGRPVLDELCGSLI